MDVTCATCGADNPESARFCRKCGTPLGDAAFTEAPTRSLEGNPDTGQPARSLNTFGSSPFAPEAARYAPPIHSPESANLHGFGNVPVVRPPAPPMAKPGSSGTRWLLILGAFLLLAILGGAAAVAVIASKIRSSHGNPPVVVTTPTAPPHEDADDDDESDTADADDDEDFDSDQLPENLRPWYYENAKGHPVVTNTDGMSLLVMKTTDSPSEVADFYREQFKDRGVTTRSVDTGDSVVFKADALDPEVDVMIAGKNKPHGRGSDADLTNVVVKIGGMPIPLNVPGFGGDAPVAPPAPPAPPSDKALPKPPAVPKVQR